MRLVGSVRSMRLGAGLVAVLGLAFAGTPAAAMGHHEMGGHGGATVVRPGESIQAAIDAAAPGDTIRVLPGDYVESPSATIALHITKPLSLIGGPAPDWHAHRNPHVSGDKQVRILAAAGQEHGIVVEPANDGDPDIDGLVIQGFTVENFENNGIWLRHVKNFRIEGNQSVNNLENGIFPTLSANGLVKKNVSYGSQDSALWVEGSQNVRVVANELSQAPTGLEITISNKVTAERNNIHDNTVGVGLYNPATAGLPEEQWPAYWDDGEWHIQKNWVHDNNTENSAAGDSETAALPYGSGILLLGVHDVHIDRNWVADNDFFGIALVNYCAAVSPTPFNCNAHPVPAEPKPVNNVVAKNILVNNHAAPPPGLFSSFASDMLEIVDLIDLLVPGTSPSTDCFDKNKIFNTPPLTPLTIPDPLPACTASN